jgi:hypothetical protein
LKCPIDGSTYIEVNSQLKEEIINE